MTTRRSKPDVINKSTKKPENEIKASWRDESSARVLVTYNKCLDCQAMFPIYSRNNLRFIRCADCAARLCRRKFGTRVIR